MNNAVDAIMECVFQEADKVSKEPKPSDTKKLIALGYLRGLISALYINGQITDERYRELHKELNCSKIIGSTFFKKVK